MLSNFLNNLRRLLSRRRNSLVSFHSSLQNYCTMGDNDNTSVLSDFVNRNPRNMEMLRIARKPQGYSLDSPKINYWYKLKFEVTNKGLEAWIEHHSGRKVVFVSTVEWGLRKQLFSTKDSSAAQNLGRVLAQRCLQAGIYEVHTDLEGTSSKVSLFLNALKDGGITLGEVYQIREKATYPTVHQMPCLPWEITEEDVDKLDAKKIISQSVEDNNPTNSDSDSL